MGAGRKTLISHRAVDGGPVLLTSKTHQRDKALRIVRAARQTGPRLSQKDLRAKQTREYRNISCNVASATEGPPRFSSRPGSCNRILHVTKPELGTKRRCNSCETKFFDLHQEPIVCPKCSAVFTPPRPDPVRLRRPP